MQRSRNFLNPRSIAYASLFIALSVVINTFRIGSVSFGGFPIIFSGYVLGPVMGFIVGAMADIVGFIVRPSGNAFNPVFVLTSALTGMLPILVTKLLGDRHPEYKLWKIFVGVLVGQVVTSVVMVPFFVDLLYAKGTFYVNMVRAAAKQAPSIPVYALLIKIIFDRIKRFV